MNEKEIKAYRSVTAPISIKDRILTQKEYEKRHFGIKAVLSYSLVAAASLLLILSLVFWDNSPKLYFNENEVSSEFIKVAEINSQNMIRTMSLEPSVTEIELEIKPESDTVVTVSDGLIKTEGKQRGKKAKITKDTRLIWLLEFLPDTDGFTLELKTEKETLVYSISLNKEGNTLLMKKIK